MIFPKAKAGEALAIGEDIWSTGVTYDWDKVHPGLKVTFSIGLSHDPSVKEAKKMLASACAKLYEAKRAGKNRIIEL